MVLPHVTEPLVVRTDDGAELALWRHSGEKETENRERPPLLLVHGTFSNRSFFGGANGLAQYLADRGYDAWVAELRGRRAGAADAGRDFEDWIVGDAPALVQAALQATGAGRLIWIGHSAGAVIGAGFAARSAAGAAALAGLVMLAAPAPHAPGAVHVVTAAAGHAVGALLGRFPAAALRIGPADESPGILRQWFRWNAGGRWVGRDGFDYTGAAARVEIPALAVAGAGDLLTPPSACRRLLDDLGGSDKSFVVCGRAEGFSQNFTHNRLVISSAARREVWPVVAQWLDAKAS
jgi:predicted alpha/beta hydrolase